MPLYICTTLPHLVRCRCCMGVREFFTMVAFSDTTVCPFTCLKVRLPAEPFSFFKKRTPRNKRKDYRDVEGRLLSVQGRYMGKEDKPRFRFPRGSHVGMYNKPVIKRLKQGDELWITEGPSDSWAMLSAGHKAVAIPSATSLTRADIALLRDELPEGVSLHMYPDNDEPGMKLFEDLKRWFPQLQGHVLPEGYKDFGQWYAEHVY